MAHVSFLLTTDDPELGEDEEVWLGASHDALFLVDDFPAPIRIRCFAKIFFEVGESGDFELALWSQDLDGNDIEQWHALDYKLPAVATQRLPREQAFWLCEGVTVTKPCERVLTIKLNGDELAQRLLVVWPTPDSVEQLTG